MKRKIIGSFFIIAFAYLFISALTPVPAVTTFTLVPTDTVRLVDDINTPIKAKMKIKIDQAYYCDLDNDKKEDDIVVHFTLGIEVEDWDDIEYYKLDVALKLPSGLTYVHRYYLKTKPSEHSVLYMYNHATEPGWYTVSMYSEAYLADGRSIDCSDALIFDPPEGIGGTEPPITKLMI